MTRLTLEIVVKTLFNSDISNDADHIGQILTMLVKPFASQATLKWILDNRLPTPGHRRYFNAVSEIDRIVFRIIAERRASGYDEGDLLSMLLQAQDDDGTQMSDAQLRDEVMTLFLAGHETTALALSWSWYLLATHPEAEKKFHAELDEVLGGKSADCFGSAEAEVHGDDREGDDAIVSAGVCGWARGDRRDGDRRVSRAERNSAIRVSMGHASRSALLR